MIREWHVIEFPRREDDKGYSLNKWGRQEADWNKYHDRANEAFAWCQGPMVHGRFSRNLAWSSTFYFKNRKDAMAFKLTFGGS